MVDGVPSDKVKEISFVVVRGISSNLSDDGNSNLSRGGHPDPSREDDSFFWVSLNPQITGIEVDPEGWMY